MSRISKKRRIEMLEEIKAEEELRIIHLMKEADIYSPSLTPLLENYLDAFIIYKSMFEAWRDEGFPPTKLHENKAGAVNEMKHPLAQHVETWNDKKNKLLESLGLTNKGKNTSKTPQNGGNSPSIDELAAHRAKWRGAQ